MRNLDLGNTPLWIIITWLVFGCFCSNGAEEGQYGLSVRNGVLVRDGKPYRGIGVNYFDAFGRHLRDAGNTTFDEGFQKLAEAKIPFARMAACGFWPVDNKLYRENRDEYFRRLDNVVNSAGKHGVGLIPSLFWALATVPDIVGEPVCEWGNPQSKTHEYMRTYVKEIVTRYKDSAVIWGWEFGNEYNLAANLPNAAKHRPPTWVKLGNPATRSEKDELTVEMVRCAIAAFAAEVRKYDSHRIIISGNSTPRESAWHNWKERKWTKDAPEQNTEMLKVGNPDPVDTVCIHAYNSGEGKLDAAGKIRNTMPCSIETGKPLFVGEFGTENKDAEQAKEEFEDIIAVIEKEKVPLAAAWVYDLKSQKDWNIAWYTPRSSWLQILTSANERIRVKSWK